MAIDLTKLSTILTSHDGTAALNELNLKDSTSQKIKDYFTRQTLNKTPQAADTLAEIAAYDTNHDGKIDKSERQAAGLTKAEARAFNKALKSLQEKDNLRAEKGDDKTTDYKDEGGHTVFSITKLDNGTKTKFYDKDGNVTKTVTEDENGITTKEKNGNTKTTTIEYSEAKSQSNGGLNKKVETVTTNADGSTTTTVTSTYSGRSDGLKEKVEEVTKNADGSTTTTVTYTCSGRSDGLEEQKDVYTNNGNECTVTCTYENGNPVITTYIKNTDGGWEEKTETTEDVETPADETPADKPAETAAEKKAQEVFENSKQVTIDESGSTNLINSKCKDRKWTTNVRIADDTEYNNAGYPEKLSIELPSEYDRNGKTRVQNLTLVDGTDNVYSSGGGRRYYLMTVGEDGSITIKHVHYDSESKKTSELTDEDNAELKAKLDKDIQVARQKAEAARKAAEQKKAEKQKNQQAYQNGAEVGSEISNRDKYDRVKTIIFDEVNKDNVLYFLKGYQEKKWGVHDNFFKQLHMEAKCYPDAFYYNAIWNIAIKLYNHLSDIGQTDLANRFNDAFANYNKNKNDANAEALDTIVQEALKKIE